MITLETFNQIDLRVGQVVQAQRIGRMRRAFKLQVDLGDEKRQVVADLAHFYEPEEIVGQQVVLIANLTPGIIHGERSQGKLLIVENPGQVLTFVRPERASLNGSPVR